MRGTPHERGAAGCKHLYCVVCWHRKSAVSVEVACVDHRVIHVAAVAPGSSSSTRMLRGSGLWQSLVSIDVHHHGMKDWPQGMSVAPGQQGVQTLERANSDPWSHSRVSQRRDPAHIATARAGLGV